MNETTFESAFETVKELVEKFKQGERHYLSADYNETEARKDFIDKFFIALGWDVNHDHQSDPYQQEVKVEKTQSNQKRTDYTFFLHPNFKDAKFFVEAKKPARTLRNAQDYFQAVRYGWNANTPVSVLTDFEELHIIDCRYRPDVNSVLSNQNHKQYHYSQYADKEIFSAIYYLLSREAVAGNSLERYSETLPKPRGKAIQKGLFKGGYQTIDESFLEYLDEVREALAKAFKKNDASLTSEELTEATQRTIDRLVFIRFLEDKLIEQENYVSEFGDSGSSWTDFISACKKLDAKYNGIVFKGNFIDKQSFKGPELSEFRNICNEICHLNSPYDFNAIPIHILGSIYERFLGKVVHATEHRVKIEEKPEVRKAGGVYYTPKYIVDYIVNNTVGKLIEGKTPEQISKLRFADIACGSGSFLIGVWDCLLEYHNKYYQKNPDKAKKDKCIEKDGRWVLSIKQKQNILRNNIYGVDIDQQATEVTQLSLSLKMLEDETTATANEMQVLFHEKILPDMSKNIVCGNSLIGTDILTQNIFPGDEERKLNPMDFESAFPEVFRSKTEKGYLYTPPEGLDEDQGYDTSQLNEPMTPYKKKIKGGFDVIIGNPPYLGFQEGTTIAKQYFSDNYQSSKGKYDHYILFTEKALNLLKDSGIFGYIIPNKFMQSNYGSEIKNIILKRTIIEIVDFKDKQVFKGATNYPCIIIIKNKKSNNAFDYKIVKGPLGANILFDILKISQQDLSTGNWILVNKIEETLLGKISKKGIPLGNISIAITQGLRTGGLNVFHSNLNKGIIKSQELERELVLPIFTGKNIKRYETTLDEKTDLLLFPYKKDYATPVEIDRYPKAKRYLEKYKIELRERKDSGKIFKNTNKLWYEYWDSKPLCFQSPKIIFPDISSRNNFHLDINGIGYLNTCYSIFLKEGFDYKFILGILNSSLIEYFMKKICPSVRGGFFRYKTGYVKQIPIPTNLQKTQQDKIAQSVEQMLGAKKQLQIAKTDKDKTYYENKCQSLDRQIDNLVYELYELTEEEIKVVEGK